VEIFGFRFMFSSQDKGYTFTALPMAAQICEKKKNNFLFGNAFLSISMLKITYKSCYNETGVKMMLGKGEHRYANVGKDKILG